MKIRKRLLRGLAGVFAGVCALAITKSTAFAASGIKSLADFNCGAAQVLDSIDCATDGDFATPIVEKGEDDGDEDADPDPEPEPPSGLVMVDVRNYLNIREEPTTDATIVGYMYADCGGTILENGDGWTKIESGELIGWASNDYLLFGEEAEELAEDVGHSFATIQADALRVRKEPSEKAGIYGVVKKNEVIETNADRNTDEWLSIEFESYEGFISADYVDIEFKVDSGETMEQVAERKKKEKEEKAKLIANFGPTVIGTTEDVLLGALVQCEAGNQPYEGQLAVAAVVMNRVRSGAYPNTVSAVIYASGQFTPAGNGKVEAQIQKGVKDSCMQAAREAIAGQTNIGTATHFRRAGNHDGVIIGDHVFW